MSSNNCDQFYVTLPSNSNLDIAPTNKPNDFKVILAEPLNLDGKWQVGLAEIKLPAPQGNIAMDMVINFRYSRKEVANKLKFASAATPVEGWYYFSIVIEAGHYPTIYTLIDKFNAAIKRHLSTPVIQDDEMRKNFQNKFTLLHMHLYPEHWMVRMLTHLETMEMLLTDNNSQFFKLLNMNLTDVARNQWIPLLLGARDNTRNWFTNSKSIPTAYVYCDLAEYQFVGDTRAPLLRVIQLSPPSNQAEIHKFEKPYYLNVVKNNVSTIEIKILDGNGEPIGLQHDKSTLVLHFRRISIA